MQVVELRRKWIFINIGKRFSDGGNWYSSYLSLSYYCPFQSPLGVTWVVVTSVPSCEKPFFWSKQDVAMWYRFWRPFGWQMSFRMQSLPFYPWFSFRWLVFYPVIESVLIISRWIQSLHGAAINVWEHLLVDIITGYHHHASWKYDISVRDGVCLPPSSSGSSGTEVCWCIDPLVCCFWIVFAWEVPYLMCSPGVWQV